MYNVKWYKNGVEVADDNKWIHTRASTNNNNKLGFDGAEGSVTSQNFALDQYCLVIFNIKSSDTGEYTCKAVNTAGGTVLLGTVTINNVGITVIDHFGNNAWDLKSDTTLAAGYTVQALNSDGTIKTTPSVGDTVIFSCGGVCKPKGQTSNSISYKWTLDGDQLSDKREYSLEMTSTNKNSLDYQCRITNSDCVDNLSTTKGVVSLTATGTIISNINKVYGRSKENH